MPVWVIDTLKPKNGLDFAVVEAVDVAVEGYASLADAVTHFATQTAIDAINTALGTKANTSDVNTAVANLQGQIDQIVISASAESVVAPEVAQSRVDEDGNEFTTLKERLDSHDSHANATQQELRNDFTTVAGTYVNKSTGAQASLAGCFTTDYVPLTYAIAVKTSVSDDASGICFYDKNKTFISGYNPYSDNGTEVLLNSPNNAAYVRITCKNAFKSNFICRYNNVLPILTEEISTLNESAAKASEDIDSLEASISGGIAKATVTFYSGYYVNNVAQELKPLAAFNYSELIELKSGETIRVTGARSNTITVVDLLSKWTANGAYDESITAYSSTDTTSAEYTATDDIEYIRVCSIPIPTVSKTVNGIESEITEVNSRVDTVAEELAEVEINAITYDVDDLEVTLNEGQYINRNGTLMTLASYGYTDSVTLTRGNAVSITSSDGAGDAVSRISLWTANGQYIRTVAYGTEEVTTATYTATEAVEYVRFSYPLTREVVLKSKTLNVPAGFSASVNSIIDERLEPIIGNNVGFSIAMFESVAFCGDSYVKGQIYNSQGLVGDRPNLAWGSCMGRLFGVDSHIYASSGADTHSWQERSDCLPRALSESARGLYIFCLGINDSSYVTTGSIDDITDYESYEDYPNTFYGNYGKIIEQIMAHAPNSKIIIMTPYSPTYNERYVTPITEITEHYGIAMINTRESALCMGEFRDLIVGGHPTAPLHSAMANDIEGLIRKCIADNYSYFKDYAGV